MTDAKKIYQHLPKEVKRCFIKTWKVRGLISEDYDALYAQYLNVTNCDNCLCVFGTFGDGTGTYKVMDHSHVTGLFRNFLCSNCNIARGETNWDEDGKKCEKCGHLNHY